MKLGSKQFVFLATALLLVLFVHKSAFAQTVSPTNRPLKELRQEIKTLREESKDLREKSRELREKSASRSSEAKKKMCEVRVKNIKTRAEKIAERAEKMYTRIDAIVLAVQKYYTEKMVPEGKTISNYDALVADISTKKEAIKPLIEKVKVDAENFSCEKENAKSSFVTFRSDMQAVIQGFKNYKTSVRNLIVAVKSAHGSATPSAAPTL